MQVGLRRKWLKFKFAPHPLTTCALQRTDDGPNEDTPNNSNKTVIMRVPTQSLLPRVECA